MGNGLSGINSSGGRQTPVIAQQDPPKRAVKSDNICDHPVLLDNLILAADANGGDLPQYTLFGNSVNSTVNYYNKYSEDKTYTGDVGALTRRHNVFNPIYGGIAGFVPDFIIPEANATQLRMTQNICADNPQTE